jgi:inhibitor of KinA sporulation pathway (predicted exonuclease)
MALSPDYLVIIDLEASGNDTYNVNRSEITEWPWVVYDARNLLVVDAKQVFIAPQWSPNPNPSPEQVENLDTDVAFSPSLKDAVAKFDAYLYSSFAVHHKTFCLLADGPWDLRHLLLLEAARKAVSLAPHFRTFFNLRTEFERCYPTAPPPADRQHMVDFLSIPASAKAVGLESCHVLADIVTRLQHDAHVFATPEVIPEFDWAAMSARVPAVAVPVAAAVPVGGVVRLRGLPWTCVEQDVADFFLGIPIVPKGIHFVKNAHGKATGEAFVQLHAIESVQHALQRHKQTMGRRYIEVFKSNPVDMSNHLGRADARRRRRPRVAQPVRPGRAGHAVWFVRAVTASRCRLGLAAPPLSRRALCHRARHRALASPAAPASEAAARRRGAACSGQRDRQVFRPQGGRPALARHAR